MLLTIIMLSFIEACEGDLDKFCLSRSTTYGNRIANQLKVSKTVIINLSKIHQ